jgi:tetratricopeptide (TPR) repeat protein
MKQYAKAIKDLSEAIELGPENPGLFRDRGKAYYGIGQYEGAIRDFSKAIESDPNNSDLLWWRGSTYTNIKEYSRAVTDLSMAIELDSDNPGPLRDRGTAYFKSTQYKSAMSDWAKSVEMDWLGRDINDGKHSAMRWLAWGYATCPVDSLRNGKKAIELARVACENTNMKDPFYLDTLAAAYAEDGDLKSALEWQEKAISLLTDENRATYETDFKNRLELYKSGKPYHENP